MNKEKMVADKPTRQLNTHGIKLNFGRHNGERWTRVPVGYLKWLVNEVGGLKGELAQSELNRRGTKMPTELKLSGHAIDRASQITKSWQEEGVHSWLTTIANEALKQGIKAKKEKIKYKGYKFCFAYGASYPTLKTITK